MRCSQKKRFNVKLKPADANKGYDYGGMTGLKSFEIDGSVCFFDPAHKWLHRILACPDCYGPMRACSDGSCKRKRRLGGGAGPSASTAAASRVAAIRARGN